MPPAAAEGPFHKDKAPADTCSSRRRIRHPSPAAPAAHRSTGPADTPSGHRTASGRRTTSARRTVSGPRTAGGRRTAACRRTACDRQTAGGRQTGVGPERGTAAGSAHPAGEDSRSGLAVLEAKSSGLIDTSDLTRSPSPGTAGPVDTAGPEADTPPWEAAPPRLGLLEEAVCDLRPREVRSANLRDCLVGVPLSPFDIRLPCCSCLLVVPADVGSRGGGCR